ncbi:MAG: hypothetical protein V2I67_17595, partial [Thermoanaerobaculales bacterium]|nr:hypothetical protein [Thermoanaerobaculales bacterium]
MRHEVRLMMSILVLVLSAGLAAAHDEDEISDEAAGQSVAPREWQFRFGLVAVDTQNLTRVEIEPGVVDARVSGGGGGSLYLERRFTPLLGLEFGMMGIGADMSVSSGIDLKYIGTEVEMLGMGVISFGANLHFLRDGRVDIYAGPFLAYNRYDKMTVHTWTDGDWWPWHRDGEWSTVQVKSDSELSWGAKA